MTATLMTDYVDEVDSSFIEKVGLYVTSRERGEGNVFVQMNNNVYRYDNVPFEAYNNLVEAPSVGAEYHVFASTFGPSDEVVQDAELEQIDEDFRIAMFPEPEPETEVSEDQLTIDDVEDEAMDVSDWFASIIAAASSEYEQPLEEQEVVGYTYSDEEIRADAIRAASNLLSRRKATPEDALEVAKAFEEFIKNGS